MKDIKFNEVKTFAKGEILLAQGEIAKYGYLVRSGCLKSYTIDSVGKEHILQFAPESWIISDLDSFTNQVPSLVFIEAIEDCEILCISKLGFKDIDSLEKKL